MAEKVQITRTKQASEGLSKEWQDWLSRNALREKRCESDRKDPQPTSND